MRRFFNYIFHLPPHHVDLWLYFFIAFFGAWAAAFASDEAAKYINAAVLFWLRSWCASLSAGLLAIKMVRSDAFRRDRPKPEVKTVP